MSLFLDCFKNISVFLDWYVQGCRAMHVIRSFRKYILFTFEVFLWFYAFRNVKVHVFVNVYEACVIRPRLFAIFILLYWEAGSPTLHNHCHAGWSYWICSFLICCLISQTVFPAHPLSLPEWLLNDDVLLGQTEICLSIYVRLYCYVLLLKAMFLHLHAFGQRLKHTDT